MSASESRLRILVTRTLPSVAMDLLQEEAAKHSATINCWEEAEAPMARADICARVRGCDGLLCLLTDSIDAEVMDLAGPQLKVISTMSVGFDHIDLEAANLRGIPVCHIGSLDASTAELAMTLSLIVARRIVPALDALREGRVGAWSPLGFCGMGVQGKTIGVVGFGNIGQLYARLMHGLGCRVLYTDVAPRPVEAVAAGAEFTTLDDLLSRADIVSVHVPLLPATRGFCGSSFFAKMQSHAVIINTSRGPVLDQEALLTALDDGKIAGAGLDVTVPEPLPKDHPLLRHPRCVVLPHVGSATVDTREAMAKRAVTNLFAGLLRTNVDDHGHIPLQVNTAVTLGRF